MILLFLASGFTLGLLERPAVMFFSCSFVSISGRFFSLGLKLKLLAKIWKRPEGRFRDLAFFSQRVYPRAF